MLGVWIATDGGGFCMAYATVGYFEKVHRGVCREAAKERLEAASMLIDWLTHNHIVAVGFESLTKFQQSAVRKACCLIADYMARDDAAMRVDVDSFSLHDMQLRMRRRKMRPWEAAGCGQWAWTTLMSTGLMRRDVI